MRLAYSCTAFLEQQKLKTALLFHATPSRMSKPRFPPEFSQQAKQVDDALPLCARLRAITQLTLILESAHCPASACFIEATRGILCLTRGRSSMILSLSGRRAATLLLFCLASCYL